MSISSPVLTPANTSVIDQIHKHNSIRKYKTEPLPVGLIETIVSAGQRAATSSNLQTYAVIAVTDAAKKTEIAHWCGDQAHIIEAPVFMAWCADLSKLDRAAQLRQLPHSHEYVESFLVSAIDVALAAQNAVLAAESLGLGTCYIGGLRNNTRQIIRLLGLPPLVFPLFGLTVGWPAAAPIQRPRLPQQAMLHWEGYSRKHEDAALLEYDQAMAATGAYNNRQVPVPGKPDAMEDYGWLEHSARRVTQPLRVELREVLQEQGFELK
jgi:FMN reductase (NADPH)